MRDFRTEVGLKGQKTESLAGAAVACDYPLFVVMLAILTLGLFMVLDASYAHATQKGQSHGDAYYFFRQQARYALGGLVVLLVAMKCRYWKLSRYGIPAIAVAIALLALVMVIGVHSHGAGRWLKLGPVQIQPSEVAKLCSVLFLAAYLSRRHRALRERWSVLLIALAPVLIAAGFIIKEPDIGTALTLVATAFVMLAVGGAGMGRLALVGFVLISVVLAIALSNPYSRKRLESYFVNDPTNRTYSYQAEQSMAALRAGGIKGLGLGQGDAKFFHLPAPYTDMIAATLGEEMGLVGSLTLLGLFFVFTMRGYHIAHRCPNAYGSLLATGLCTMVTVQALLNLAVVTRSVPNTGVPLPMVSYGGTSLVLVLFATGLLLSVSRWPELRNIEALVDPGRTQNRLADDAGSTGPFRLDGDLQEATG